MAPELEPTPVQIEELKRRLQDDRSVVVEVLSEADYQTGHIPGAYNIPQGAEDFDGRFRRLVPEKTTPIVVYCADQTCQASARAARRLSELGYEDVYDYEAGKQGWVEAGERLSGRLPETESLAEEEQSLNWQEQDKPGRAFADDLL